MELRRQGVDHLSGDLHSAIPFQFRQRGAVHSTAQQDLPQRLMTESDPCCVLCPRKPKPFPRSLNRGRKIPVSHVYMSTTLVADAQVFTLKWRRQ